LGEDVPPAISIPPRAVAAPPVVRESMFFLEKNFFTAFTPPTGYCLTIFRVLIFSVPPQTPTPAPLFYSPLCHKARHFRSQRSLLFFGLFCLDRFCSKTTKAPRRFRSLSVWSHPLVLHSACYHLTLTISSVSRPEISLRAPSIMAIDFFFSAPSHVTRLIFPLFSTIELTGVFSVLPFYSIPFSPLQCRLFFSPPHT